MDDYEKKYIIFGCGKIGKEALEYLGETNVFCFVDNDASLSGDVIYGKRIISFEELKGICENYTVVIAARLSFAYEIKEQLENNNIYDYQLFEYMRQKRNYWREEYQIVKKQLDELKEQYRADSINVEFYLVDAFEIAHFKPLYELLRINKINAVFVAENILNNTTHDWFDYDEALRILQEENLEYRNECNVNAHIVFTTQYASVLKKYKNAIKINMTYALALYKESYEFSKEAMRGFDYKLVHGQLMWEECVAKRILDKEHIKIIGFPKHYELIGKRLDRDRILGELGIKTDKPIIGYFPTWDENSSIIAFEKSIRELKQNFFIVTKAHHCTYRLPDKKHELKILYDISDIVLEGNYEFEKAAMIGDINICDAKSGAALETCLINDKAKAIFLSLHDKKEHYFMEELYKIACVVDQPDQLKAIITRVMDKDIYQSVRNKGMDRYFDKSINKLELWGILKDIIDTTLKQKEQCVSDVKQYQKKY